MGSNYVGNGVRLVVSFYNPDGGLGDPSAVSVEVTNPNSLVVTYTYGSSGIVKQGTGQYYLYIIPGVVGTWRYKWVGATGLDAVNYGQFVVDPAPS